jgi:hypothetical protein
MKVNVLKPTEIELKPRDKVEIDFNKPWVKVTYVVRLVESLHKTYAVLSNGTYRPMSTYGFTWRKVND